MKSVFTRSIKSVLVIILFCFKEKDLICSNAYFLRIFIGKLINQIKYLRKILILKLIFQEHRVISGKTVFFVKGPLLLPILFVLTL